MKKLLIRLLVFLLGLSVLSCHRDDSPPVHVTHPFSFGFSLIAERSGKLQTRDIPAKVRVSIRSASGENIYTDKALDLFSFGGGYVSEIIELQADEYELTLFQILNGSGEVIMATPLTGSEKATAVEYPLPIPFIVTQGKTDRLSPEVLWVGELETPGQFGYVEFGFELVNNFALNVAVIADYDGSFVQSFVLLSSFSKDSLLLDEKIYPYQSGYESINLDATAHFYELSVASSFHHSVKYYLKTEDLLALDQLELLLSPKSFSHQFTLSPATAPYQNEMKLYLPKDGCTRYIRLDRTGAYSFYTHLSYGVVDRQTGSSLIPPEMIESYAKNPSSIIYPVNTTLGHQADNVCQDLNDQLQEELAFDIEVIILTDDGEEFEYFVFNWNSEDGKWIETE